jgi:hypothetical protein
MHLDFGVASGIAVAGDGTDIRLFDGRSAHVDAFGEFLFVETE